MNDQMTNQILKMVVIDDIETVVNGIVNRFDWKDFDIEIAGTAFNGDEGLSLIRRTMPDIIITDIQMPKLSGIEMVQNVLNLIPGSKIIFISGYSDFENAQQAVKLGAFDYILKPFTSKQLLEVIQKASALRREDLSKAEQNIHMVQKLRESIPLLRQDYLNLLIRYSSDPEAVKKRWDLLEIDMKEENLAVAVVELDDKEGKYTIPINEMELMRFAVQNIMEETLQMHTNGIIFRDGTSRFVCIMNHSPVLSPEEIGERWREHIKAFAKRTVSIGIGNTVDRIYELPASYQQALTAVSYHFYTGGDCVFSSGDLGQYQDERSIRLSVEKEKELFYTIRSGNMNKLVEELEKIFVEWTRLNETDQWPSPDRLKFSYLELALSVDKEFASLTEDLDKQSFDHKFNELMYQCTTIDCLKQTTLDLCGLYCALFAKKHTPEADLIVAESIRYIRSHLHINATVSDYANQVHLSPSYYANLFKKVTGQSVIQFVLQERMEEAKKLLLEGMTVHEVASSVGYEERAYFSEVFKKQLGQTPTEFRQAYHGG
ncbi:response regulator [Paenibacillus sp. HB172176]|uniref:response regulator n=1 Tax=Paenibacillus sp. HB172176 TaxID=2493690 RepID=UPI001439DA3C|nr:response regulator [Paenibacillus sp. HB172176]